MVESIQPGAHLCNFGAIFDQVQVELGCLRAQLVLVERGDYRRGNGLRFMRLHQQPVDAGCDPFAQAFQIASHRKTAARHGFKQGVGGAVVGGDRYRYRTAGKQRPKLPLWQSRQQHHPPVKM